MKHLKGILALGLILATGTSVYGQYEGLNPRHWFPLELGNYWHYHLNDVGQETDYILTTDRDTLLDGKRWVHFKEIACEGWSCGRDDWYHFTADHYLVRSFRLQSQPDTLWYTLPHSVFTVSAPLDTLTTYESGSNIPFPFPIEIRENNFGLVADTTHLSLVLNALLFTQIYTYNIGLSYQGIEGNVELIGAYVDGRFLGNTSWISEAVATEDDKPPSMPFEIEIFPNPVHREAHLRIISDLGGAFQISVVNALGQVVYNTHTQFLPGHHGQRLTFEHLPAGLYLLRVQHYAHAITRKLFLIK
jgi:hypothetical protein